MCARARERVRVSVGAWVRARVCTGPPLDLRCPGDPLFLWGGKISALRPSKKFHPRRKTLVLTFPLSQQTGSRLRALQEV